MQTNKGSKMKKLLIASLVLAAASAQAHQNDVGNFLLGAAIGAVVANQMNNNDQPVQQPQVVYQQAPVVYQRSTWARPVQYQYNTTCFSVVTPNSQVTTCTR
jgi:hypothetical protein